MRLGNASIKQRERICKGQPRREVRRRSNDLAARAERAGVWSDDMLSELSTSPEDVNIEHYMHVGHNGLTTYSERVPIPISAYQQDTSIADQAPPSSVPITYHDLLLHGQAPVLDQTAPEWVRADKACALRATLVSGKPLLEIQLLETFFSYFQPVWQLKEDSTGWIESLRNIVEQYEPLRYIALAIAAVDLTNDLTINHVQADLHMSYQSLSIGGLHRDLYDPDKYGSESTILTVVLLCRYELLVGTSSSAYRANIQGLNAMIKAKGPSFFESGIMSNILIMNQGDEIRRCLEMGTASFYSEPEWAALSGKLCPQIYNQFIGTPLNSLLLRLMDLTSGNQRSDRLARILEKDLCEERLKWLSKSPFVVYNQDLCAEHQRAKKIRLDLSPCGDSLSYDDPGSGQCYLSMAAITFDSAILHLHRVYRKLRTPEDKVRAILTLRCAQYIMANERFQELYTAGELAFHLVTAQKFVERDTALQAWVTHSLHLTGVPLWSRYSADKPRYQTTAAQVLSFLVPPS